MHKALCVLLVFVVAVYSHSMMICANYDTATNKCKAPVRNSGQSLREQAFTYTNGGNVCQIGFISPISDFYGGSSKCTGGGPCADPMGTIAAGSKFNVMWYARNHADSNGGTIAVYLSPAITGSTTADPSADTFAQNQLCAGSYGTCPSGNGDAVNCYIECTMPANQPAGTYTLWWKWNWNGPMYSTCADIVVTGAGAGSTTTTTTTGNTQTSTTSSSSSTSTTGTQASTSGSSVEGSGQVTFTFTTTDHIPKEDFIVKIAAILKIDSSNVVVDSYSSTSSQANNGVIVYTVSVVFRITGTNGQDKANQLEEMVASNDSAISGAGFNNAVAVVEESQGSSASVVAVGALAAVMLPFVL